MRKSLVDLKFNFLFVLVFSIFIVLFLVFIFFFFFQAEDGIRDGTVTGVQTCALPISRCAHARIVRMRRGTRYGVFDSRRTPNTGPAVFRGSGWKRTRTVDLALTSASRSEERRVGKECRSRWWPDHEKKKSVTRSGDEG